MPSIFVKAKTDTNPTTIPPTGASVRFLVNARCLGGMQAARFGFRLDAVDGFAWTNGASATLAEGTATLDGQWRLHPFTFALTATTATSVKILIVKIEAEPVNAVGTPIRQVKSSVAFLTVSSPLAALLVAHRSANSLTQENLAQKVSVSRAWISDIEHGAAPSETVLRSLKAVVE